MASSVSGPSGPSVSYQSGNQEVATISHDNSSPIDGAVEASVLFQFSRRKIEEVFSRGVRSAGDVTDSIDPQRVTVLTSTLLRLIQERSQTPINQLTKEDIKEWLEAAEGAELNGSKVILLLSERGLVDGGGGESYVFAGIRDDKSYCAVKWLKENKDSDEIARRNTLFMKLSEIPYLVHYYGFVALPPDDGGDVCEGQCLIEEWCSESLYGLYQRAVLKGDPAAKQELNQKLASFIKQILIGVSGMHERNIVHGDIKLENILISECGNQIRISDLNGAVELPAPLKATTLSFYSPEQIEDLRLRWQRLEESSEEEAPAELEIDLKKCEVWQTMLAIAQIGEDSLSQPFQDVIEEYLNLCIGQEKKAIIEGENKFSSFELDAGYGKSYTVQCFTKEMGAYFENLSKSQEGLFSHLTPTNPLEELLVGISHFRSESRMTSAKASQFAQDNL